MEIQCPKCHATYQVDGSKIPPNGAYATCSKCHTRFHIDKQKASDGESKQETITCPNCGHQQPKSAECENCGIIFSKYYAAQKKAKEEAKRRLVKCKTCGKEISKNAEFCPHCGEPLVSSESSHEEKQVPIGSHEEAEKKLKEEKKRKYRIGFLGVLLVIIVLIEFGVFSTSDRDKASSGKVAREKVAREKVANSARDGSVYQVKSYLKKHLRDPGSFDAIEWSPVAKTSDGGYQARCKYRAKNAFGGYVMSNQVFVMDSNGNVISVSDY